MKDAKESDEAFVGDTDKINTSIKDKPRYFASRRFRFAIIVFVANILLYIHRVNLNMAIVCMLEATELDILEVKNKTWQELEMHVSYNNESTDGDVRQHVEYNMVKHSFTNISHGSLHVPHNDSYTLEKVNDDMTTEGFETGNDTLMKQQFQYEFSWNKAETSLLLSASYYGAVVSEVLGGYFAHRFGGKHVISVCLTSSAILSLLSPAAASTSYAFIFIIRILLGFSGGLFTPAMYTLMMHWTTPKERASVLSFCLSGQPFGIVLAYITSGFLCTLGWSIIFYVHGVVTLVFMLLWLFEVRNTPGQHSKITQAETILLMTTPVKISKKSAPATPWKSILLSRPQWAVTIVHFVYNWSLFTVVINVPLFLKEAYAYIISENGVFSALPYVFSAVTWMFSGTLSAVIISKGRLSVQATRKTLTTISLGGSAVCLISAGHVTYELRFLAVALICVSCVFGGLSYGGYIPSYTEFAGIFSGTAFAISNALADAAVIVSATVAGLMTPNGKQEEWRNVFYLAAGLNILGGIVYCLFGEATLQEWAKVDKYSSTKATEIITDKDNGRDDLNSSVE